MIRLVAIEKEVRSRPIGSSIADILRDLGVSPSLCAGPFWYAVSLALRSYRGNIATFMRDMRRREARFAEEVDRTPGAEWPQPTREAIGKILGFFVGETPRDPADAAPAESVVAAQLTDWLAPAASLAVAAATGPP